MAAAVGHEWSHSSPPPQSLSSPDTTSPMYPDRLIRPLPKRRLRSRLSEEEAKTIEFPPNPPQVAPLFNLPHVDRPQNYAVRAPRGEVDDHECSCGVDHGVRHQGAELDGLDGTHERIGRRTGFGEAALEEDGHYPQAWEHQPGSYSKPPPPPSTTSSADGYESFENTNNKKKRKIPLSGGAHHHTSLSAEMVNMSISNPVHDSSLAEDAAGAGVQYYGQSPNVQHSSPGTGISGAGRGRYGRPRHSLDRRPLGASTNGLNAYSGAGNAKLPPSDQGIISAAIANAAEQGTLSSPVEGDENVSLVQQQAAKSVSPQTSQFTFSMDSQSSKTLYNAPPSSGLPGPGHGAPAGYAHPQSKMRSGGQPLPGVAGAHPQSQRQHQQPAGGQQPPPADPNAAPQRRRKPLSKLYQLAARQRRLQQEYQNYHNPPRVAGDIWICEFCEYEAIFGKEPRALVWQYEEKDRRERKRLAEKRRLLEKAKMKGRKNRKGSKKGKNSANAAAANSQKQGGAGQPYDDQGGDVLPELEPDRDEFYDDEFDDEPVAGGPPPPSTPTMEAQDPMGIRGGGGGGGGGGHEQAGGGQQQTRAPPPVGRTRKA